ncbi:MAG TPA: hypothetical protein VGO49_14145 [Bradyrhizobium sp.]|jgi:hypothetical protein|nr:hypothetical protein [Bradyrhizobium sp.]
MRELNFLQTEDEKTRVLKGFEILLDILKGNPLKASVRESKTSAEIIPFPMQPFPDWDETNRKVALSPATAIRSKKSMKQKFRQLSLFEFAEGSSEKAAPNVVRNRSKEWFDKYGYRGD